MPPGGQSGGTEGHGGGFSGGRARDPRGAGGRQIDMRDFLGAGLGARSPGGGYGRVGNFSTGPARIGNATLADYEMAKRYGLDPGQYDARVREYASRLRDYLDTGNSAIDNLGNRVAGAFGFSEMNPDFSASTTPTPTRASWGFDPVAAAATIAGAAFGVPGLGAFYQGIKKATGFPGAQFALGEDVFGGGVPGNGAPGQPVDAHDSKDGFWPIVPPAAMAKPSDEGMGMLFRMRALGDPAWRHSR